MSSREVPIVFSANDKYVPYLGVTLCSLIDNISPDHEYCIYIFYREMKEYNIFRLENMSSVHVSVKCIDVSEQLKDKHYYGGPVEATKHISEETFYRLLIPEVLPWYKKILYLDCDIILLGDVAELYRTDLHGNIFGAVYSVEFWNEERTGTVPEKKAQEWFNAGVLLIDMELFQKENCPQKCTRLMENQIFDVVDQDVLRIVGYGKTHYLPYEWNVMWHHLQSEINGLKEHNRTVYYETAGHPKIIHYSSGIKPWNRPGGALAGYFWQYARESEFYEEILYQNLNGRMREEENIFGTYLFPFDRVKRGSDIILYGAGNVGKTFKRQIDETGWCNVVAWADQNYSTKEGRTLNLIEPEKLKDISCKCIVVAIEKEKIAVQIMEKIREVIGEEAKVLWEKPRRKIK